MLVVAATISFGWILFDGQDGRAPILRGGGGKKTRSKLKENVVDASPPNTEPHHAAKNKKTDKKNQDEDGFLPEDLELDKAIDAVDFDSPMNMEEEIKKLASLDNVAVDRMEEVEKRCKDPTDALYLADTPQNLRERFLKLTEDFKVARQHYWEVRKNASLRLGARPIDATWARKEKERIRMERQRIRKKIWALPGGRAITPRDPHQIFKPQIGGGDLPEHTYFELMCGFHPRWKEDDGLPGHFVRALPSHIDREKTPLRLNKFIRKNRIPDKWYNDIVPPNNRLKFRLNWGVHNNTETIKALFKWLESNCQKTGERRAIMVFPKQNRLWYSRKMELSKIAQENGMFVIWPSRSKHLNKLYITCKGYVNLHPSMRMAQEKHLYQHPLETTYLEDKAEEQAAWHREWDKRYATYHPHNETLVPERYRLPHRYLGSRGVTRKKRIKLMNLWHALSDAGLVAGKTLEQCKYIQYKRLQMKAFPPEETRAIRKGFVSWRMWKAIFRDDPPVVRRCLEEYPELANYRGEWGETAFFTATRFNHTDIMKILLEYGADFEAKDEGMKNFWGTPITPAFLCYKYGHFYGSKIIAEEKERRAQLEFAKKVGTRGVVDDRDKTIDIGDVARDLQALELTQGTEKVLRCGQCTMPLPYGVELPYHCKACGYLMKPVAGGSRNAFPSHRSIAPMLADARRASETDFNPGRIGAS